MRRRTGRHWRRPQARAPRGRPAATLPPVAGTRPRIVRASVDLPEPDSPTRPSVSPRTTSKLTPSTALDLAGLTARVSRAIIPCRSLKYVRTSRTREEPWHRPHRRWCRSRRRSCRRQPCGSSSAMALMRRQLAAQPARGRSAAARPLVVDEAAHAALGHRQDSRLALAADGRGRGRSGRRTCSRAASASRLGTRPGIAASILPALLAAKAPRRAGRACKGAVDRSKIENTPRLFDRAAGVHHDHALGRPRRSRRGCGRSAGSRCRGSR